MKETIQKVLSAHPFGMFKRREPSSEMIDRLDARLTSLSRKRVLFVEDDEQLQELMQQVERNMRVEVVGAQTAGMAKALLRQRNFDLAILDVGILNGDGIALYEWIQQHYPALNVIFLTGGSIDEVASKVHKLGSAPIYSKPTVNTVGFLCDLLRFCAGAKRSAASTA